MNFIVGDIIIADTTKHIPLSYDITNEYSTCKIVNIETDITRDGERIQVATVEVIDHKQQDHKKYIGSTYTIFLKYFKLFQYEPSVTKLSKLINDIYLREKQKYEQSFSI